MRGLTKLQKLSAKNSTKRLKGKRKRQYETLHAQVTGQEFQLDTSDGRFAALLDGEDDRYGIDRTNPAYRETGGMATLLREQSERRRKKQEKCKEGSVDDKLAAGGSWVEQSAGAMELSSLVKSLQSKVNTK